MRQKASLSRCAEFKGCWDEPGEENRTSRKFIRHVAKTVNGPLKRQAKGDEDETANPDIGVFLGGNGITCCSEFVCSEHGLCRLWRSGRSERKAAERLGPEGQGRS